MEVISDDKSYQRIYDLLYDLLNSYAILYILHNIAIYHIAWPIFKWCKIIRSFRKENVPIGLLL